MPTLATTRYTVQVIALLVLCSLGMAVTILWYYGRQREAMETAAIQELSAIVEANKALIVHWRDERIGDGRVLSYTAAFKAGRSVLASGAATSTERQDMNNVLGAMKREFRYSNAVLVNNLGVTIWQLESRRENDSERRRMERATLVKAAQQARDVLLSDISEDASSASRLITLTVPIHEIGAFQLELSPSKVLYPYLSAWPGAGRSGEILLVRREGNEIVYLSDRRYATHSAGLARRSLRGVPLPAEAAMEAGAALRSRDYRDIAVLGEARRIKGSSWIMIAKMDEAEVDEPIARLGRELAVVMGLIALTNAAGIGFLWKSRQLRLQQESEQRFRAIADDTPALLWMVSPDTKSIFINRGLKDFVGRDESIVSFGPAADIHCDDLPRVTARLQACWQDRSTYSDEFRLRRKDGTFRRVACQGAPRFSAGRTFLGYAGCLLDVTDLKDTEEKLTRANAVLESALSEKTRREAEIQALSDRLINAQEDERRKVSRELHDDLSQRIAALSIAMGNLKRSLSEQQAEARKDSDDIQKDLVVLSDVVRRISHELHPAVLQHSGLAAAIRQYCREFQGLTRITVDLTTVGDLKAVPVEIALNIYRIAQEALRNVAKHAGVDRAEVRLSRNGHSLRLVVADHGCGISKDMAPRPFGLGLVSIRERARLIGGTVDLQSTAGEGTVITVEVPINNGTWGYSEIRI